MAVYVLIAVAALAAVVAVDARRPRGERTFSGEALAEDARLPDAVEERAEAARLRNGFDVVLRGYRMDQVDRRIERLEAENAELERALERTRERSAGETGTGPLRGASA